MNDEINWKAGFEPDAMTLAKAKREEELLEECEDAEEVSKV